MNFAGRASENIGMAGGMVMQALRQTDPSGGGEGEGCRAVRDRHPSTILFVGTIDGISILKSALPLNDWGRACYRNGFREPRMQEPPRSLSCEQNSY